MVISIAGGTGFVGTNLCRYLVEQHPKDHIIAIDNFSSSTQLGVEDLLSRKNFSLINGDITNETLIQEVFENHQPNIVINAVHTADEEISIQTITHGNYLLLKHAHTTLQSLQNFIYISTDEVYGDTITASGNIQPGIETAHMTPKTPIAAAEAGADLLTTAFHQKYKLPTTVLRTSNLFGPYQLDSRLIPTLITHALHNRDIPIYGEGTHTRNWLYIHDFVRFVDQVIRTHDESTIGEVYNVAGITEHSVLEITQLILTVLNRPSELITFIEDKQPDTTYRVLDSGKAQSAFNWAPHADFKNALQETILWYKQRYER